MMPGLRLIQLEVTDKVEVIAQTVLKINFAVYIMGRWDKQRD